MCVCVCWRFYQIVPGIYCNLYPQHIAISSNTTTNIPITPRPSHLSISTLYTTMTTTNSVGGGNNSHTHKLCTSCYLALYLALLAMRMSAMQAGVFVVSCDAVTLTRKVGKMTDTVQAVAAYDHISPFCRSWHGN